MCLLKIKLRIMPITIRISLILQLFCWHDLYSLSILLFVSIARGHKPHFQTVQYLVSIYALGRFAYVCVLCFSFLVKACAFSQHSAGFLLLLSRFSWSFAGQREPFLFTGIWCLLMMRELQWSKKLMQSTGNLR